MTRFSKVKNTMLVLITMILAAISVSSCQRIKMDRGDNVDISTGHIQQTKAMAVSGDIPAPISVAPSLPVPQIQKKEATHTVIVNDVPVAELLFSLARDAKLNADIDNGITDTVTLNAINQPLDALLERITENANLTYSIKNGVLRVSRDRPFWRNYRVDYINMSRSSQSSSTVSTQIGSTGQGASTGSGGSNNNSSTEVINKTESSFWDTLHSNIASIIYIDKTIENTKVASVIPVGELGTAEATVPVAESQEASTELADNRNIILNRESGLMGVRATKKQHAEVAEFINEVIYSSRRQVLIEATIAEVSLSDSYQAGIDWTVLANRVDSTSNISQTLTDIVLFDRPAFTLQLDQNNSDGDTIQTTLSALSTFGDVRIMSSPKVMALNNQTALLKVVDNVVYFTVDVSIEAGDANSSSLITYETEINTIPVGFVMSVTPYISDTDSVTLSVRPTISRVIGQARDPNPALAEAGVISEIPIVQVREVESILKVNSGDTAVMGGLMQDEIDNNSRGIPLISKIPGLGRLFRYDADTTEKTELVIFIRPIVVKHASLQGDLQQYQEYLPKSSR